MRPAVIPKLSELPSDPERRNAVLDSAHAEPGPENRPVSKKARKVETAAAPDRDNLRQQMSRQRLDRLARSLLLDMRNQAFIDIRIKAGAAAL